MSRRRIAVAVALIGVVPVASGCPGPKYPRTEAGLLELPAKIRGALEGTRCQTASECKVVTCSNGEPGTCEGGFCTYTKRDDCTCYEGEVRYCTIAMATTGCRDGAQACDLRPGYNGWTECYPLASCGGSSVEAGTSSSERRGSLGGSSNVTKAPLTVFVNWDGVTVDNNDPEDATANRANISGSLFGLPSQCAHDNPTHDEPCCTTGTKVSIPAFQAIPNKGGREFQIAYTMCYLDYIFRDYDVTLTTERPHQATIQ